MRLDALLRPRSIAILGASERPSIGRALMESAATLGYEGRIYPINPRYAEILGQRCYPSMRELPEQPDVVAMCVSYTRMVESFRAVADKGAGAAVIYDGGFAEHGDEGRRRQAELVGMCCEAGIALCGPNCMGILNPHHRSSVYMQEVRDPAGLAGNVALVSQSGSICIGMLADIRRFGFSHVVSSGNEAVLGTAQYLEALVDDPDTRVIATFTEWIAEPERYVAALDSAADVGKPVVVLKVGRHERTRRAIGTHTGGLAGESAVFSAMLRAHRAIEVSDLDELTEVLAVCQGRRWPTGRRLAVVTASGGQAELILDVATAAGLELPPLSAEGRKEIERVIGGRARPTIHEHDAKRLLAQHGLSVVRERLVRSVGDARKAAHDLGYPVVLKVVADDLPHRSDLGLVRVGLVDAAALEAAWATLERRLRETTPRTSIDGFVVQALIAGGVEVFAGVKRDPAFGHFLAFGVGGVAVEVLRDFALRQLPLRDGDAEAMVGEIRGAALLGAVRGQPAADVPALVRCLYALGDFAWANRADIAEIDLNPIKVLPAGHGAVVVDALIVPSPRERTE